MSKHRGAPRRIMSGRRTRFGPLVAIMAALALLFGMLGISAPAQATGNNGTIKIHEEGTPVGTESNDPKVCSFNIESYNLDAGQDGYIVFDVQGGDGPVGTPAGPFDFGPADETGFFATEYYSLDNGHYMATLYGKFGDGSINYEDVKAKSKVFKVECPPPPVEPEGGNTSFSSDCEFITVGTPTGVKPEGATVVVKLNGVVTQPGTYAVAPGEYTVTTFVNDTLVDTDVVTVAKCEDEVTPVAPTEPTSSDVCEPATGATNDRITIPTDANFTYQVDGVTVAAGAFVASGTSHAVTAVPNKDVVVKEGAKTSWTFTFTKVACVITTPPPPPVPTPVPTPTPTPEPVKDNPKASVSASCVTARFGEAEVRLNNSRSTVSNKFRIVRNGPDKVVTLKAGSKRTVNLTGLRVGSVVKVVSGGKLLAKTRVKGGCTPAPNPDTGFRMAATTAT